MFDAHEVEIDLEWVDSDTCLMIVLTPVGRIEIIGTVWIEDETLFIDEAHIDGPGRGTISRHGLNAIGNKVLEVADVKKICIQGGTRTTGKNPGRPPWPIQFPRCPGNTSGREN